MKQKWAPSRHFAWYLCKQSIHKNLYYVFDQWSIDMIDARSTVTPEMWPPVAGPKLRMWKIRPSDFQLFQPRALFRCHCTFCSYGSRSFKHHEHPANLKRKEEMNSLLFSQNADNITRLISTCSTTKWLFKEKEKRESILPFCLIFRPCFWQKVTLIAISEESDVSEIKLLSLKF